MTKPIQIFTAMITLFVGVVTWISWKNETKIDAKELFRIYLTQPPFNYITIIITGIMILYMMYILIWGYPSRIKEVKS